MTWGEKYLRCKTKLMIYVRWSCLHREDKFQQLDNWSTLLSHIWPNLGFKISLYCMYFLTKILKFAKIKNDIR